MKQISKRLFGAILAMVMLVSMVPNGVFKATATAASIQSDYVTGDIITYGSYPQTKVTDSSLITSLNAQTLQVDSTVTFGDTKYKRVYFTTATNSYQATNGYNINTVYWFKFEPLKWRVLANTNGELFVMAEKILDSKAYNQVYTNVTWETCTMRSWLNNDFYNTAFNSTEQSKIKTSTVVNADNPSYGTEGGNDTSDKLFLLSYAEAKNPAYGFSSYTTTRRAQGTDFSKSNGLYVYNSSSYLGNSDWWVRSPGDSPDGAGVVYGDGGVSNGYDSSVGSTGIGARPAFKINLSSDIFTSIKILSDSYTQSIGSTLLIGANFSSSTLAFNSSTVSYAFSDPSAFSVSGGMIFTGTASSGMVSISAKALKAGTYTVTFSTSDGASSTCTIEVRGGVNITKGGTALADNLQIKVPWYRFYNNSKNDIQLGISTDIGTDVTAVWSSDNPGKVQVDQTGKVKNFKTGARSANITVKLLDSENNVIATDTVKLIFYKFKSQLKNL